MFSDDLANRLRIALASGSARDELWALLGGTNPFGQHWYVNAEVTNSGDGTSPSQGFKTMAEAFAKVDNDDTIHLRGPIYENLTVPQKTGVTILGDGAGLRHGSTTNTSEGYAPSWRTGSGVTDEPLLIMTTQGWTIANILFSPPSAETGIELHSDTTGTYEETMSGTRIIGCRFAQGKYAITDDGGSGFVSVIGNRFEGQTTCSIETLNTAHAVPLQWEVRDNYFGYLSASHIRVSASSWNIKNNTFAKVASTAVYIDLTYISGQGLNNVVTQNTFAGVYTTADYIGAATDLWLGNWVTVVSTQAPNGFTIAIAAA